MAPVWRTAVVTGAAGGIGRAFATELAHRGADLALLDVAADPLAEVVDEVRAYGRRAETLVADVGDRSAVEEAAGAAVRLLGGIDLVVHCAAVLGPGAFAAMPPAVFERVVRVDLLGTVNVIRALLPALRATRGVAVCLASTAAVRGWPLLGAYSAAKCGVAGFCDAVRPELAREGVHLLAVYPLLVDTPLLAGADGPPLLRGGRRVAPALVVGRTLAAARARRPRVYVPRAVRLLAALHGVAPRLVDWYARRAGFDG